MTEEGEFPQNVSIEVESMTHERPLDLWPLQLKYVLRLSGETLQGWIERLFEGRPFPVILSGTDPAVFAIYIYGAAPLVFQQRFRVAVKQLVQAYHPQFHSVSYLGNLIYVCAQIRIIEAYATFMEVIYSRVFEKRFSSARDEAAGHDVQSHLIAATAALMPPNDHRIVNYCRRIIKGDLPKEYVPLAFRVLSEFDENNATKYLGAFLDSLVMYPEVEKLDHVRSTISALVARYGGFSANGHVDQLLEKCREGPILDVNLRRSRMLLYATLFGLKFYSRREELAQSNRFLEESPACADMDYTYMKTCNKIAGALKEVYGISDLEAVYEDIPITRGIDLYARETKSLREIEELILDQSKFHEVELRLLELATVKPRPEHSGKLEDGSVLPDPLDLKGTTELLVEKLKQVA